MTPSRRPQPHALRRDLHAVDLDLEQDVYDEIVADMERNGGVHRPADQWELKTLFGDDEEKVRKPTFADLVYPWIGSASQPASDRDVAACRTFLDKYVGRGKLPTSTEEMLEAEPPPSSAELLAVVDVALIIAYTETRTDEPLRILEVGGGYGRLAEAFLRLPQQELSYVLVDAVPASLYYAYRYLKSSFPDRSIGSYYVDSDAHISEFDCYVAPTWHFERLAMPFYDVGVNISSMQEMLPTHVAYYLDLFDRIIRRGGTIYLWNSRDWAYQNEYEYPPKWRRRLMTNAPISWSIHHPIEIFTRTDGDWTDANAKIEAAYLRDICGAYRDALTDRVAGLRDRVEKLSTRLREEREVHVGRIEALTRAFEAQRAANERLTEANASLRETTEKLSTRLGEEREVHVGRIEALTRAFEAQRAANERLAEANLSLREATGNLPARLVQERKTERPAAAGARSTARSQAARE